MSKFFFMLVLYDDLNIGNVSENLFYALLKGERLNKKVKLVRKWMFCDRLLGRIFKRRQLLGVYRLQSPSLITKDYFIIKIVGLWYGFLFWTNFISQAMLWKLKLVKNMRLQLIGCEYQDLFNINLDITFNINSIKQIAWASLLNKNQEVSLYPQDEAKCQAILRRLGVQPEQWYVCLHIRTGHYHGDPSSYHRNSRIENYIEAMRYIRSLGGIVIRLGDSVPLGYEDYYIDYPNTSFRSELMDLFLIKHCRFFWGTNSGVFDTALLLGIPTLAVNVSDYLFVRPYKSIDIFIYKPIFSYVQKKIISFHEAFQISGDIIHTNCNISVFERFNKEYELIENTSEEIAGAVKEMLSNLECLSEETVVQKKFKEELNQCSYRWIREGHYAPHVENACRAAIKTYFNGRVGREFSERYIY